MWQPFETMSQQCCTVMLCCANITFRNELYQLIRIIVLGRANRHSLRTSGADIIRHFLH